jgi:hypothetical protein
MAMGVGLYFKHDRDDDILDEQESIYKQSVPFDYK